MPCLASLVVGSSCATGDVTLVPWVHLHTHRAVVVRDTRHFKCSLLGTVMTECGLPESAFDANETRC